MSALLSRAAANKTVDTQKKRQDARQGWHESISVPTTRTVTRSSQVNSNKPRRSFVRSQKPRLSTGRLYFAISALCTSSRQVMLCASLFYRSYYALL